MKIEKLSTKRICELENYHYGKDTKGAPLFHMWPATYFMKSASSLAYPPQRTISVELAPHQTMTSSRDACPCSCTYRERDSKLTARTHDSGNRTRPYDSPDTTKARHYLDSPLDGTWHCVPEPGTFLI